MPEGEKPFFESYRNVIPGTRIWCQWLAGKIWHYNTTQSVGDGAGMYVYAPPGQPVGWLCAMDTGVQPVVKEGKTVSDDLKDYRGISLWIKGDGSEATAVFSTNWSFSRHKFRVPLGDTEWHKVFMPWDKWDEPITGHFWYLTFGLERADHTTASWFIVDRVHLFREERTEAITPTPDGDPPGGIPAKDYVVGEDQFPRTLAKLKARRPVTIVAAGDSIAWGAQLGYTRAGYKSPDSDMRKFAYWHLLGDRLREAFGYPTVGRWLRTFDAKAAKWVESPAEHARAELNVVAVATGGWTSAQGLAHLDEVLRVKPDLVLWGYGANDATSGDWRGYAKASRAAVEKLQKSSIEVVLQSVIPRSDPLPKAWLGGDSLIGAT